jgi:hypothetical protein
MLINIRIERPISIPILILIRRLIGPTCLSFLFLPLLEQFLEATDLNVAILGVEV